MVRPDWKIEALVDVINFALGWFLFFSPWIFGFKSDLGWHTSWMAGGAIGIFAIFAIGVLLEALFASGDVLDSVAPDFFEEQEWLNVTIGLWLAVCPWILDFHDDATAMQVHLAVGLAVATIAVVELWVMRHPRHKKGRPA